MRSNHSLFIERTNCFVNAMQLQVLAPGSELAPRPLSFIPPRFSKQYSQIGLLKSSGKYQNPYYTQNTVHAQSFGMNKQGNN
jgi:hypothetical protein